MKVLCSDKCDFPAELEKNCFYFSFFENSGNPNIGTIGQELLKNIQKNGIRPSIEAFDFLRIALAINAADQVCERAHSQDGWTREIELEISLCDTTKWEILKPQFHTMLRKLTGDFWSLIFTNCNKQFTWKEPNLDKLKYYNEATCVSLLSGGMDSLIGGIDLVSDGEKPIFVSQIVRDDRQKQIQYAKAFKASERHLQWSHATRFRARSERSSRARSIVFYAFALLATELLTNQNPRKIIVPENGFISLNVPLDLGRFGSLSTKTTHPLILKSLQEIWQQVGLNVELFNPYQFMTKGEMVLECKDSKLLKRYISSTTSCSRYLTYGHMHCGRCVPCMVRRAAFKAGNMVDSTKYSIKKLAKGGIENDANDISAVAMACLMKEKKGIRYFAGSLAFAEPETATLYEKVVETGVNELHSLLKYHKVIS